MNSHLSPAVSSLSSPNKLNGQPRRQTFTTNVSCNLWSQRFSCSSPIGAPDTSILMLQCWLLGSCVASCPAAGWTFGGPGLRPAQPSMRPSAHRTKGSLCGHGGQRAATSNNRSGPKRPLDVKQTCLLNSPCVWKVLPSGQLDLIRRQK